MTATRQERPPEATRRLARWAGATYVSLGVATLFGFYHAPLIHGDLDALAQAIARSDLRFRVGVLSDVLATVLTVPLALLLYQLFVPVHRAQAALMAVLLLVAMPISFVGALNYVAAQWLLAGASEVAAFAGAQQEALGILFLHLHTHLVLAEEVFWGLWLLPFGLLVMRSRFLPRVLGLLLLIAGVAWFAHGVTSLLLAGQRILLYERVTWLARAAGEFPIMLWLLIKGTDGRGVSSGAA